MQPKYLIRFTRFRRRGVSQHDKLPFHYPEAQKEIRRDYVGGIPFSTMKGTGRYETNRVIAYLHDAAVSVPLTREGVKAAVRELRPQEAGRLDALDAEIEATKERLRTLHQERDAALHEAFARGHVVTVHDMRAVADAKLIDVKERKAPK